MVLVFPATANEHLSPGETAVVDGTNGYGLNIRTEPTVNSDVHFVADEGTPMEVTDGPHEAEGSLWYSVHIDGTDAWVMADFISSDASNASVQETAGTQVEVVETNGHGLRLRIDASSNADTVTVLPEGTVVDVVGADVVDEAGTTWVHVSYNGSTGYSHSNYLSVVNDDGQQNEPEADPDQADQSNPDEGQDNHSAVEEPEPEPEPEPADPNGVAVGGNAEVVNTNGSGLNVRSGAGYGNSVVTVAGEGHVMHVLAGPEVDGEGANWWNVDYLGHSGWVHGGYLQGTDAEPTGTNSGSGQSADDDNGNAPSASPAGQRIANEAMQYLGYPYVWGGTTPAGFDCSGFLYHVVNQVTDHNLSRILEAQVNAGTYVPSDQLQPGDLVFQQNTYQWGLSHAGIYIGDGQFIHASTPGSGVIISNLWDGYWGQRYYTARRIS